MTNPRNLTQFAFAAGLAEDQQEEVLDPTAGFTRLENVRQDRRGSLTKRLGFTQLTRTRLDATTRSAGRKVFSAGDRLCTIDGTTLDVYSETSARWTTIGSVPEASASLRDAPSLSGTSARACDVAVCNGYVVLAQTTGTDLVLSVQDADGTVIRAGDSPSNISVARLGTYGVYVVATYIVAGNANVNVTYLDCTSAATLLTGWSTPTAISTDKITAGTAASRALAMANLSDRVAIAYVNNSGGTDELTIKTWNVASGVLETETVNTSSATPDFIELASASTTLWVAWNEALDVKVLGTTGSSLATTLATTATVASALDAVVRVWLVAGHASGRGRLFVQDGTRLRSQGFQTTAGATTTDGSQGQYLGPFLATRPMLYGTSYYAAAYQLFDISQTASDFILVDVTTSTDTLRPVASVEPGLVVPSDGYNMPGIVALSASTYVTLVHLIRSSTVNATELVVYDFTDTNRWQPVEHGGATYLTGGVLTKFDGTRLAEVPFLAKPYTPSSTRAAGSLSPSVGYRWVATYETADGDGNWIVGAVSNPSDLSSLTASSQYTVTSTPLAITTRYGTYSATNGTRIAFYRTTDGGSVYYFVDADDVNPSTAPSIVDNTTDTTLQTRAKLYGTGVLPGTNGAGQDRRAPPGFSCLVSYGDMLVGAAGSTLWYSSQAVLGEGVWFNPLFRLDMVDGGEVTALAAQDGTLFVFKRRGIFAVTGEPPSDNGASGGLGTPRRLAVDVGCVDPRSVVVTSLGIFFQSERGIELLSRSQSVEWIGEPVQETLSTRAVVAATLDSAAALVRFECATESFGAVAPTGVCLVYDLTLKVWVSVDKIAGSFGALASASAQSACMGYLADAWRYVRLDTSGVVYYERDAINASAHLDEAAWVTMVAESAWLKLGGIQGNHMLEKVLVLARKATRADLSFSVAYDYSGTYETAATWTATVLDGLETNIGRIQIAHGVHDEAEGVAVRVLLQDATPTGGTVGSGKGHTWIALSFQGTAREGATHLPDEAR